ncbi:MAG: DUF6057 family protein, partial [Tannerella sp.]|jgi:hypothetical protein|nr:DUF6057 family protein [Tannerella sp.]
LSKEIVLFNGLLEKYYGTAVLPQLPVSFQEAVVILSEQDSSYLERYSISEPVINSFNDFRRQIVANKNNTAVLPGLLKKSHGNTYWYYYMFK